MLIPMYFFYSVVIEFDLSKSIQAAFFVSYSFAKAVLTSYSLDLTLNSFSLNFHSNLAVF